jgi:polyisoprenoid-binding protein YceI
VAFFNTWARRARNLDAFTDSHLLERKQVSALYMNALAIAPTMGLIATLGVLVAAAPRAGNPPVDHPGPLAVAHETWPAPNAVLRSGTLSFTGHSTVGDFVGTTTAVDGGVAGNAELANARGWVEASVIGLSTGNRLRDRDLRATMDVDKFPTMRFELAGVSVESPASPSDTVAGTLRGALTIHGVSRDVSIPSTLIAAGDTIDVSGAFQVDLADYNVGGLTKLFGTLRVRRDIDVRFRVRFEATAHPREWRFPG